nr:VWA domain-containing protein [Nocardioides sp. KC13]
MLGFTRALRAAGVQVTQDRAQGFLQATAIVGADEPVATYTAGRATLCAGPDDLRRYDQVFEAWFGSTAALPGPQGPPRTVSVTSTLPETEPQDGDDTGEGDGDVIRARASEIETLRHRDVADLDPAEQERLATLIARLSPRAPRRRTPRQDHWRRGRVDAHRTLRASLRHLGEPAGIHYRRRGERPRRVVWLIDVSGSMSAYADVLLRVAHRVSSAGPANAVFTMGTRLTNVTRALRHRDPDRALVAAGETVPDWSGGTRLGDNLQAFLRRHQGLARGAVMVIASDGWERGDTALLQEQTARLHRLAHRTVWVNPHRGKVGYEPLQRGIVAVLPHVDDFVAGHSLATYEDLVEVIARA